MSNQNIGADPDGGSLPLPQAKCQADGMGSTPTAPTTPATPSPEQVAIQAILTRFSGQTFSGDYRVAHAWLEKEIASHVASRVLAEKAKAWEDGHQVCPNCPCTNPYIPKEQKHGG